MAEKSPAEKPSSEVTRIYHIARAKKYQISEYDKNGIIVVAVYDRTTGKALGIDRGGSTKGEIPQPSAVALGEVREDVLRRALDAWVIEKKRLRDSKKRPRTTPS